MPFQLRLDRRPANKTKTWDQRLPRLGLVVEAGQWRLSYKGVTVVETYKRWQQQGLDLNKLRQVIRDQMSEFKLDRASVRKKPATKKKAKPSRKKAKPSKRAAKKGRPSLKIIRRG